MPPSMAAVMADPPTQDLCHDSVSLFIRLLCHLRAALCVQAHNRLADYGLRARLQTLWRDAHGTASAGQSQKHTSPQTKQKRKKLKESAKSEADDGAAATDDAMANTHMENVLNHPADFVSAQQKTVFAVCNSYKDLFLPNHPYPVRYDILCDCEL